MNEFASREIPHLKEKKDPVLSETKSIFQGRKLTHTEIIAQPAARNILSGLKKPEPPVDRNLPSLMASLIAFSGTR